MEGYVMGSKRLTPTIVGKIASNCLLLLLLVKIYIFEIFNIYILLVSLPVKHMIVQNNIIWVMIFL